MRENILELMMMLEVFIPLICLVKYFWPRYKVANDIEPVASLRRRGQFQEGNVSAKACNQEQKNLVPTILTVSEKSCDVWRNTPWGRILRHIPNVFAGTKALLWHLWDQLEPKVSEETVMKHFTELELYIFHTKDHPLEIGVTFQAVYCLISSSDNHPPLLNNNSQTQAYIPRGKPEQLHWTNVYLTTFTSPRHPSSDVLLVDENLRNEVHPSTSVKKVLFKKTVCIGRTFIGLTRCMIRSGTRGEKIFYWTFCRVSQVICF